MPRKLTSTDKQILKDTVYHINLLCEKFEQAGAMPFDKVETDYVNFIAIRSALQSMYDLLVEKGEL